MTSPHGNFNFASCARAAHLWETSCHTMSDWNAHHSLTLRDREGQVVYQPSSVNAGRHVIADSDSGSVVRRNAANHERSRSPAVVQVKYLFQPPPPPRHPRETSYPLPSFQCRCYLLGTGGLRLNLSHCCLAPISLHHHRLKASMLRHAVRGHKS